MGCPRMSQRMNRRAFVDSVFNERRSESVLEAALGKGLSGDGQVEMSAGLGRKGQNRIAMSGPILPK